MANLENFTYILVSFEYKISCLDIFGGYYVNLTLLWPKNCRKVQNSLNKIRDVLEKNVESTNLKFPTHGESI
jgi:hypothetical protein